MLKEDLGFYVDTKTGNRYEVLKITSISEYKPLSGNKVKRCDGSHGYITKCGVDLESIDNSHFEFELIQIDGTIRKE
ncbi:hypothetical protein [Marinomonas primoryensis]|jgi:hypothetical protein|uniref:hypothetical protein n=1 Tax=Marinomonas primoryensis TaxID=178399 RepID=UPI003704CF1C